VDAAENASRGPSSRPHLAKYRRVLQERQGQEGISISLSRNFAPKLEPMTFVISRCL